MKAYFRYKIEVLNTNFAIYVTEKIMINVNINKQRFGNI